MGVKSTISETINSLDKLTVYQILLMLCYTVPLAFMLPYALFINIVMIALVAMLATEVIIKGTRLIPAEFTASLGIVTTVFMALSSYTYSLPIVIYSCIACSVSTYIIAKYGEPENYEWILNKGKDSYWEAIASISSFFSLPLAILVSQFLMYNFGVNVLMATMGSLPILARILLLLFLSIGLALFKMQFPPLILFLFSLAATGVMAYENLVIWALAFMLALLLVALSATIIAVAERIHCITLAKKEVKVA